MEGNFDPKDKNSSTSGMDMYFDPKIAESFASHEQNDKNFRVAAIIDRIIMQEIAMYPDPLFCAELGGGAHPDRYHQLFQRLLKNPQGKIDWVDVSPFMLKLAEKYIDTPEYHARTQVISFIEKDMMVYLKELPKEVLDVAIMKYTIDYIQDLEDLFKELQRTLKKDRVFVSTIASLTPQLKSYSTNARYLYNGKEFPLDETKELKDGDTYTIKFLQESGNVNSGYIPGAQTVKYYHSPEKIKKFAEKYKFDIRLGDWKEFISEEKREGETMDQAILVLRKR